MSALLIAIVTVLTSINIGSIPATLDLRYTDIKSIEYAGELGETGLFAETSALRADARRQVPPGYGLLIWGLGKIDPGVAAGAKCVRELGSACKLPFAFKPVVAIQFVAAFACLALIFFIAWQACGGSASAVLAVLLAAAFSRFGSYIVNLEPYIAFSFLFLAFVALTVWAVNRNSNWLALIAGVTLAGVVLFHTPSILLVPIMGVALAFAAARKAPRQATSAMLPLFFLFGALAPLVPISVHNYSAFGDPLLTVEYETQLLMHRVGFNHMAAMDWVAALVRWFPLGGSTVSDLIFGVDAGQRLEQFQPGSYRHIGYAWLRNQPGEPGALAQLQSLIGHHVLPLASQHLAASLVLFFKHYWLSGAIISLPALYFVPAVIRIARGRTEVGAILVVLAACFGLLVIQALFDFRSPRIGLPLILLPCCILAYIARGT